MASDKRSLAEIKKIAKSIGLEVKNIKASGRAKLLLSNGKKICILGGDFGLYPGTLRWQQHLLASKSMTQDVLNSFGYSTIPSIVAYPKKHPSARIFIGKIMPLVKSYPLLLKPDNGLQGRDIEIITCKTKLMTALTRRYKRGKPFLMQPIIKAEEYRVLVINGKTQVIHIKRPHHIIGNGKDSIKTLLAAITDKLKDTTYISQQLTTNGYTKSTILAKDETFAYHLTGFSAPSDFYQSEQLPKSVTKWAELLAKTISIPTIGIDVFAPHGLSDSGSFQIIELNTNPALSYLRDRYGDKERLEEIIIAMLKNYFK